jgi:multidrug efflux pump subunit AcrB
MSHKHLPPLLSVLIVLLVLAVLFAIRPPRVPPSTEPESARPQPAQAKLRPVVTIETVYRGASAEVVRDCVAEPIEVHVQGLEKMLYMMSRSANDGSYTLRITLEPDADVNLAQVLVQNRVNLALPLLPDAVQRQGVTVRQVWPQALMFVSLFSPDDRHDTVYLSNYARIHLKGELATVPGVGDVIVSTQDYRIRGWLDRDRLAAHKLTPADVMKVLEQRNLQIAADHVGGRLMENGPIFAVIVNALGRLLPEELGDTILKTSANGGVVRLRDVARIELGVSAESHALFNGKPVAVVAVFPISRDPPAGMRTSLQAKLNELRDRFPDGLATDVSFEFIPERDGSKRRSAPGNLRLDLSMPRDPASEQRSKLLDRCAKLVRAVPGVQDVLALNGPPFTRSTSQACILVRLAAVESSKLRREAIIQTIRSQFGQDVQEVTLRVCDLAAPNCFPLEGYPIELAIHGPKVDQVKQWSEKFIERLRQSGKVTDLWVSPGPGAVPQVYIDIDRKAVATEQVAMADLFNTLQAYLGSAYVNDSARAGSSIQIQLEGEASGRDLRQDITKLKVRNGQGQMIPLSRLAAVRTRSAPVLIERFNGQPMVEVTANPAPSTSLAEACALCEHAAEAVRKELQLPAEYGLTWLQQLPPTRNDTNGRDL